MTGPADVRGAFPKDPRSSVEDLHTHHHAEAVEKEEAEETGGAPKTQSPATAPADKVDTAKLQASQQLNQEFEGLRSRLMEGGKPIRPAASWTDEQTGARCNLLMYEDKKTGLTRAVYTRENDTEPPQKTMTVYTINKEGGIAGKQFLQFKQKDGQWKQVLDAGIGYDAATGDFKKAEDKETKPMQDMYKQGFEGVDKKVKEYKTVESEAGKKADTEKVEGEIKQAREKRDALHKQKLDKISQRHSLESEYNRANGALNYYEELKTKDPEKFESKKNEYEEQKKITEAARAKLEKCKTEEKAIDDEDANLKDKVIPGLEEKLARVKSGQRLEEPQAVEPPTAQSKEKSLVLRDAKEGEKNKSEDGKVVYDGKVLDVPYLPYQEAHDNFFNSITQVKDGPDGASKDFLSSCFEQTNEKLADLLSKPEYVKFKKENIEKLISEGKKEEAGQLKGQKMQIFTYLLSEIVISNAHNKETAVVPEGLLISALQTRSASLEEYAGR